MTQADKIYNEAIAHGLSERVAEHMVFNYFAGDRDCLLAWIEARQDED